MTGFASVRGWLRQGPGGSRPRGRRKRSPAGRAAWGLSWRHRWVWIGCGLIVAMMMAVWERSAVVSLGYEVGELRKVRDQEMQRHRALILESASLSSLDRIEQLATARLGLVHAEPGQIQLVHVDRPADSAIALAETKRLARLERQP